MPGNLLPVTIGGEIVYIEAEPTYGSQSTTSAERAADQVSGAFERSKTAVMAIAKSMVEAMRSMEEIAAPDEFSTEFSIKFSAEGNVILARAMSEANIKVIIKYKSKQ